VKFFDRIEIFFCLTSTQMELNSNLLNLNNRNFGSIEKFRLVENRLDNLFRFCVLKLSQFFNISKHLYLAYEVIVYLDNKFSKPKIRL
jgi:hypothetical protein